MDSSLWALSEIGISKRQIDAVFVRGRYRCLLTSCPLVSRFEQFLRGAGLNFVRLTHDDTANQ